MESYHEILSKNAPRSKWRVMIRSIFFPDSHRLMEQAMGRDVKEGRVKVDWFDGFSLFMIVVNTVTLALADPLHPESELSKALEITDWVFSFFFFVELLIRIAAFGFIIYKADFWNIFDAGIVITGVASAIMEILRFSPISLTSLRTVRVLRPLRSIRLIHGARLMIVATVNAVKSLADVGLLGVLFLILFGVSGVSQYNSRIRTRCVNEDYNHPNRSLAVESMGLSSDTTLTAIQDYVRFNKYEAAVKTYARIILEDHCFHPRRCAQLYRTAHSQWRMDVEPDLTRFNESKCMKYLPPGEMPNSSSSFWPILVPPTPLLNMTNATEAAELSYLPDYFVAQARVYDCLYQSPSSILELPPLDAKFRKQAEAVLGAWPDWISERWSQHSCDDTKAIVLKGFKCPYDYQCIKIENPFFGIVGFDNLPQALLTLFVSITLQLWYNVMYMMVDAIDPTASMYFVMVIILGAFFIVNLGVVLITVEYERCSQEEKERLKEYRGVELPLVVVMKAKWQNMSDRVKNKINVDKEVAQLRKVAQQILHSVYGQVAINLMIFLNIALMATEHYGMSNELVTILDAFNIAFTIAFTIELVIRMMASEFREFCRSILNIIDVVVIVVSWMDIASDEYSIPVVRAIRALRLLNVFKSFPQMYRWITIIIHSLRSSFMLSLMILFTLFVFSSLGMHLFGGHFCDLSFNDVRPDNTVDFCLNRPRANFDTMVSAMISSFIIMTADDWEDIMYNGMRSRGNIFSVFFVVFFIISNYILVNLLVGIVLSVRADAEAAELEELEMLEAEEEIDESLLEQPQFSKTQLMLQAKLSGTAFQIFIIFVIILSSVCLALESPISAPDTTNEQILRWMDNLCNVIFLGEVVLAMVAWGIIKKRWCYLRRDGWNVFDTLLVIFALVGWILEYLNKGDDTAGPLRALRVLRAIRPFRFVKRSKGLKLVVSTLTKSIKPLGNLLIVIIIVFTMWGIMGVQLYKGSFYSCSNKQLKTKKECLESGDNWVNADMHFDHLPAAFLSLFTVATLEGWAAIMFDGIDAVGPDVAPEVNHRRRNSLFFISFVVVGGFFFVNLFVSIIIDSYQKARLHDGSTYSRFLTPAQNAWIRSQHILASRVPPVDYDNMERDSAVENAFVSFRKRLRRVVRHPLFDVVIYCCIVVNFMVMAVDQYPKSHTMSVFIIVMHTTFAIVFLLEAFMKIVAESWTRYISSKWNRFDFAIVILSLVAIIAEFAFSSATFAASFRTMRALRLLRVIRKSRRLQSVLKKFLFALYSLKNVAAVLLLLFFSFGVMGIKLFGRVQRNANLTNRANFENLPNSMLLLLRVSTGGNWVDIMNSCAVEPPFCDKDIDACGLNIVAQLFFVTFMTIGMFVLINLFVAVILESFSQMQEDVDILSDWDAAQFMKLWLHFDPERTYRMESKYLMSLLRAIPPSCPLGMGELPQKRRLQHEFVFVESLELKETNGLIDLQDLIYALCQRAFKEALPEKRRRLLVSKTDRMFRREDRDRYKPSTGQFTVAERFTVMILEAYWERRKLVQERRKRYTRLKKIRNGETPSADENASNVPHQRGGRNRSPNVNVRSSPPLRNASFSGSPQSALKSPTGPATRNSGGVTFGGEEVVSTSSSYMPPALTLEGTSNATHKKTDGDPPPSSSAGEPSSGIYQPERPLSALEAVTLMHKSFFEGGGDGHNNQPHQRHQSFQDPRGGSWSVRADRQTSRDDGIREHSVTQGLEADATANPNMSSKEMLTSAIARVQSGQSRTATQQELLQVATAVHEVKKSEDAFVDSLAMQRLGLEEKEQSARGDLIVEYEIEMLDVQTLASNLRQKADEEAEALL